MTFYKDFEEETNQMESAQTNEDVGKSNSPEFVKSNE
jgi:hypothetical protein